MNAEDYLGLVTSQHRGAPRFLAWVRFLVSLFDPNVHETLNEAFSISGGEDRIFKPPNPPSTLHFMPNHHP